MVQANKSILVVGAGAIGGITAASLAKAGYPVELVCKYDDYAELASSKGLNVKGINGRYNQTVPSVASIEEIKGKRDIVLLAVKATDLEDVANRILPYLHKSSLVVSMQNGICEFDLQKIVGSERVVGCIVGWGATMKSPGNFILTSGGDFVIGYPGRVPDGALIELATILESILPVRISSELMEHLYSKLIINSCITSLGAITGLLLGNMLLRRKARILFIEIIKEAMELAYIMKINVAPYGGKLDYYRFIGHKGWKGKLVQHLLIMFIGLKYRRLKSSSLQSIERGRLTEIDYLNGFIARNGKEYGVPVPVNSTVVKMIHEIELGKREISPVNLDDWRFAKYYRNSIPIKI
jgi:2-dehydropantoate 2-reductase